jgi:hypothetical protein
MYYYGFKPFNKKKELFLTNKKSETRARTRRQWFRKEEKNSRVGSVIVHALGAKF